MLQRMKKQWTKRDVLEAALLTLSVLSITLAFFLQEGEKNALSLIASLCGTVGVLFVAKGMILGQYVCFVYALLYTALSFFNAYYGECLLAILTMVPSSLFAIFTWLKHPAKERGKVKINRLGRKEIIALGTAVVLLTVGAYFLLRALHTAQLEVSTLSVVTSLGAAYLLIRRSRFYAVFYILNDLVLIVLWILALWKGESVLPSVISFFVFLINDFYGLYDWSRRAKIQEAEEERNKGANEEEKNAEEKEV